MRKIAFKRYFIIAAMVLAACSCTSEELTSHLKKGKAITFGISMAGITPTTKTSYSGEVTDSYERIDWVDGDLITIACPESDVAASDGATIADYKITSHSNTGKISKGSIEIADTKSRLLWGSATDYHFYSVYPSPKTPGVQSGVSFEESTHTLTAVLPAGQTTTTIESGVMKPDMKLAYMGAGTTHKLTVSDSNVSLDFYPLVTTFDVTIINGTSDEMKLYSAGIRSTSTALTGTYTAEIESDGTFVADCPDYESDNSTITIDYGGESNPTVLAIGQSVKFTLFALPHDITDLSVFVETSDGTRTLALKQNGTSIVFNACGKYNLNNLKVPDVSNYEFIVTAPSLTTFGIGRYSSQTFSVTSTKGKTAVGWTTEYSTDGGTTWTTTAPDTFFNSSASGSFPSSGDGGSNVKQSFTVSVQKSEYESQSDNKWDKKLQSTASVSDVDLSLRDVNGNATSRNTANCYVVRAAGSYKFPCVYGNAIKNGNTNTGAYESPYKDDSSVTGILKTFVDYQDQNITQPWIKNYDTLLKTRVSINMLTNSASLLWEDVEGLITNVSLESGSDGYYITFKVDQNTIKQGNAVIALKGVSGVILWSWHIWVTSMDLTAQTSTDSYFGKAEILPVNIGWVSTTDLVFQPSEVLIRFTQKESGNTQEFTLTRPEFRVLQGYNTYFQWGRKDPMQPANIDYINTASSDATIYVGSFTKTSASVSIGKTIQNPMVYYTGANNSVESGSYRNLWDAEMKTSFDNNAAAERYTGNVIKTVYDPCPAGFTTPEGNQFYKLIHSDRTEIYPGVALGDLTSKEIGELLHCVLFSSDKDGEYISFNMVGRRLYSSKLSSVFRSGYYWTSTIVKNSSSSNNDESYAFCYNFTTNDNGKPLFLLNHAIEKTAAHCVRPSVEH